MPSPIPSSSEPDENISHSHASSQAAFIPQIRIGQGLRSRGLRCMLHVAHFFVDGTWKPSTHAKSNAKCQPSLTPLVRAVPIHTSVKKLGLRI